MQSIERRAIAALSFSNSICQMGSLTLADAIAQFADAKALLSRPCLCQASRSSKVRMSLRLYQFNTKTARHYFCSNCGIYTHHQRRSNPEQYGFNVGCLDGVNPFDIPNVPTNDGVNHPADRRAT